MKTLKDAWSWYDSARRLIKTTHRLGERHWSYMMDEKRFYQDATLLRHAPSDVAESSKGVLGDLDDLCVMLMFSVFEANVRDHVLATVTTDLALTSQSHPAVRRALNSLQDDVSHGSFFRVFEPYKDLNFGLAEEVNQIRKFRNWVAHGRRPPRPASVSPRDAYQILGDFLQLLVTASFQSNPPRTTTEPAELPLTADQEVASSDLPTA